MTDNEPKPLTDKERQARHRAEQKARGLLRVSGWVPRERATDARELLAGLAVGRNELLPSAVAEREAEVERLRTRLAQAEADAAAARAEAAEQRARAAEARAEGERQVFQARGEAEAALRRATEAEGRAAAVEAEAALAEGKMRQLLEAPGWRGALARWLQRWA